MVPLNEIKPNSAKIKKRDGNTVLSPEDPDRSYFKRNVPLVIKNLKEQLKKEIPVEEHAYSVLVKS